MTALIEELEPWVGRLCASIALDRAEDARQETLIIVLRSLSSLRQPAALRAWVRRIAVRESMRAAGASRDVVVDHVPDRERPEDLDLSIDVRDTLAHLSPAHRAVLVLRHLEDLSEDETAEVLGVQAGTVKSRANRARRSFARRWR